MASKRDRDKRQNRSAIMAPYWVPTTGWRHFSWWLAPALSVFCLFLGSFYAFTAPFLIPVCVAPLLVLGVIAIWALPDARSAPVRALWPLTFALSIALIAWPNYLAIDLPGLPWLTLVRLISGPLSFVFLVSFSTSRTFRSELAEQLSAAPLIWMFVAAFALLQCGTFPLAGKAFPAALQKAVIRQFDWTAVFFISCWVFRVPGRVERVLAAVWVLAVLMSIEGIWEFKIHKLPWEDHIPGFLKVDDAQRYLDAYYRTAISLYRTRGTFSTPLGMSEFLALTVPIMLHFMIGRYKIWIKAAALFSIPLVLVGIYLTDSRVGLVGSMVAVLVYIIVRAVERWRSAKSSIIGPAIVLGYPMMAGVAFALTFVSTKLREKFWGDSATYRSTQDRIEQWKMGIPKIFHNPVGYGAGQAGPTLKFMSSQGTYTVDSYYLVVLLEVGILGCLVFLLMFGSGVFYSGRYIWLNSTRVQPDRELEMLAPLGSTIVSFLLIKTVYSLSDLHCLLFMMLGMIVALSYRSRVANGLPVGWPGWGRKFRAAKAAPAA